MLIGLAGKAGSGKDTAADILCEYYGFKKLAFAEGLKTMLASVGFQEPTRENKEKQITGFAFSYRKAAQALGTEWGREVDPDIWVKLLEKKLLALGEGNFVISDVRFKNEVRLVQKLGGQIFEIQGRQVDLGGRSKHASETGLAEKDIDLVIQNDGSIEQLKRKLRSVLVWDEQN